MRRFFFSKTSPGMKAIWTFKAVLPVLKVQVALPHSHSINAKSDLGAAVCNILC